MSMLSGKVAVVYGARGRIGSTVARAFAEEGAQVVRAGHDVVDVRDPDAVDAHLASVVAEIGRIDISFNAVGFPDNQGTPLREMAVADALATVTTGFASHLVPAVAVARQMERQGSGVIITLSTSAAGLSGRDRRLHRTGAFGAACAAIEELTRSLAGELGPLGVRVVCLRPDAIPETWGDPLPAETAEVVEQMTAGTMLDRMPTLREVADAAVLVASDRASAITGTVVNVTCGSIAV